MQRLFGLILFIALLAALVGGCTDTEKTGKSSGSGSSTGTIEVRVTDAPPGYEITKVLVTVSSVEVHRAVAEKEQEQAQRPEETPVQEQEQEQQQVGDGSDAIVEEDSDGNGGEWIALGILPGQETFDLLLIQDLEQVLATDEVDAGKYTQIRMAVESVVVEYMEGAGTKTAEAEVPSGKLKFVRPFDVEADSTTALVFDFIAEKSVVFTGSDKVIFKPVIKLNVSKPKPTPSPTVSPSPTASPDPT
ncbi:MAG: DUF4382 domain-containing protein, partial [Chloroflexi bacterium]|nr:DUF4382 domain-containing protein [Chloroflexota bacterium]